MLKVLFLSLFTFSVVVITAQTDDGIKQMLKKQDSLLKIYKDPSLFFPQKKYVKVVGYTYNKGLNEENGEQSIINRKTKKIIPGRDSIKYILTKEQTQELLNILNDTTSFTEGDAGCFIPHHAFVFFDASNKPVAHIDICFMCHQAEASPHYLISKYGSLSDWGWSKLNMFCRHIGMPVERIVKTINDTIFEMGDIIKISGILYSDGRITPPNDSLDVVGDFIQRHPNLIVEVAYYTTTLGSAKYNLKLSESRAKSCVDYLVWKYKIPANRIIPKGYGESQPLISEIEINKQASEEKNRDEWFKLHLKNQRTELIVLKVN